MPLSRTVAAFAPGEARFFVASLLRMTQIRAGGPKEELILCCRIRLAGHGSQCRDLEQSASGAPAGLARPADAAHSTNAARPADAAHSTDATRPANAAHSTDATWPNRAADATGSARSADSPYSTRPHGAAYATHSTWSCWSSSWHDISLL